MNLSAEALACVRGERTVFTGLDFRLEAGGILLLRGPNGAGKSSLLRLLASLQRPAAGRLAWDGADVWDDPEAHRRRVTYVGHLDAVKPLLTVAENLGFWARLAGGGRLAPALDAFGLAHLAEVPARLLSAGQRRRTALARLELAQGPLWLLDEPDASLDEDGLARLAQAIGRQRARSGLVIVASHHDLPLGEAQTLRLGGDSG